MRLHVLACLLAFLDATAAAACPDRGREIYQARTFFGYDCNDDCALQKAGLAWAERHGISSAFACTAADAALQAGCRAYVSEGASSFDAGHAWAVENEVAEPCLCDGGGDGFRAGCLRHLGD